MKPLVGQLEALMAPGRSAAKPAGWLGLSSRETEVVRLVARGFTNREIGDRLFISERTVATHVQNIFSKTGAANRAELTALMASAGILDDGRTGK